MVNEMVFNGINAYSAIVDLLQNDEQKRYTEIFGNNTLVENKHTQNLVNNMVAVTSGYVHNSTRMRYMNQQTYNHTQRSLFPTLHSEDDTMVSWCFVHGI